MPCSQREPYTNDGIGGLEDQQCPNGQIFQEQMSAVRGTLINLVRLIV